MTRRQLHNWIHRTAGVVRALACISTISAAMCVCALQVGTPETAAAETAQAGLVSPSAVNYVNIEQAPTVNAGWQVEGSTLALRSDGQHGALDLLSGFFTSRALTPFKLSDPTSSLPGRSVGLSGALRFAGQGSDRMSDQVTFQRFSFSSGGLAVSGRYADVGADFQGLEAVTKQFQSAEPEAAKLLGRGIRRASYDISYAAGMGLSFASKASTTDNAQQGHQENGLTRTAQSNSVRLASGQRGRLDYTTSTLEESWDPTTVQRGGKRVAAQTLAFSGEMGQRSAFSLGQTLTDTHDGGQLASAAQRDLSLTWGEWKNLTFGGSFSSRLTEQTQQRNDVLKLDMTAQLTPTMKLVGKLVDDAAWTPADARKQEKDLLELALTGAAFGRLQLASQYRVDSRDPNRGEVTTLSQQLAWDRWKAGARLVDTVHPTNGESNRREYTLTRELGREPGDEQIGLLMRVDELPGEVRQNRQEISYSRSLLPALPGTLVVKAGHYDFGTADTSTGKDLLTVQVLALKPIQRASLSLGYYAGNSLGASQLGYRTWGLKPSGNLDVWTPQDIAGYQELGGELIYAVGPGTKLVLKQFNGTLEGLGGQSTVEYGLEQRLGAAVLQGGRRSITQATGTGPAQTEENWWRLALPDPKPLPEWTATAAGYSAFEDGATWGFGQALTWVRKPTRGLTAEQNDILIGSKPVAQQSLQYAGMRGDRLFLQAGFERNPYTAGRRDQVDPLEREIVHLAYALKPDVQFFARRIREERLDQTSEVLTHSLGFAGRLSPVERLQLQVDALTRETAEASRAGLAYQLEYERNLGPDEIILFKLRIMPDDFANPEDRVRLQLSFRHAF